MITIVTLYRGKTADHYVGAIQGSLTHAQRLEVAKGLHAEYGVEEDDEDGRYVYFREVEISATPADLTVVQNIDDEDYSGDTTSEDSEGDDE